MNSEAMLEQWKKNLEEMAKQRRVVAEIQVRREKEEHVRKLEIARASAPTIIVKVLG